MDLAADWRVATAKSKKTCLKTTAGKKNKNKLTKQKSRQKSKSKQKSTVRDNMPDSEPAGSSARPKTAMAESQNQNSNGGTSSQSESTNQNSARAGGSSGITMQAGGAGPSNSSATPSKAMVKYGELVILGYNGQLPQGDYFYYSAI